MEEILTLVQSMGTDKFGPVTVLGSQYRGQKGDVIWHFATWSETDTNVRLYPIADSGLPMTFEARADDGQAVIDAVIKWRLPSQQPQSFGAVIPVTGVKRIGD